MPSGSLGAVLVVDDEEPVLRTYAEILRRARFDVRVAHSGAEALTQLTTPCDVVVSDINMPGLDGLTLLRRVRQHDLDLQVILVTGQPNVNTAILAVEYGALRYLTKPLSADTLVRTVTDAVTMSRLARTKREALSVLGGHERDLGDRASLEFAFEDALARIRVAYQPIIAWRHRHVYAYEALMRLDDERLPQPLLIVAAAERLERVHELGRRVRALTAVDIVRTDLPAHVQIFVNLHPVELLDPELGSAKDPLFPFASRVVYEVTERKALLHTQATRDTLERLKSSGFRVAVDDMGAGYAGLSTFAVLEPAVMKIDMSLVRGIESSATKQRVVKSLLELGHDLRLSDVVVEGIETPSERDVVAALGADLMQGFLFGHPAAPFAKPIGLGHSGS
ncbi:MAG TPA: EAL domain-containing protein [Vicinamibacterales bacterium]|nr:EAL domain-containing protein [Vicinamibacterales bacterium]